MIIQSKEEEKDMDFQFLPLSSPFSSFMSVFFSILMATIIMIKMKNMRRQGSRLPPGPTMLPIIGNLYNLFGDSVIPRRLQHLAEKHGPLMHLKLGQISTVVVSSSDLAMDALKNNDLAVSDRMTTSTLKDLTYNLSDVGFSPYGEYWRQMKKICTVELLSVKRVKSFMKFRQEEVANMIKSISQAADAGTPVNLTEKFQIVSSNIITRSAFGEKCKSPERLMLSTKEGAEFTNRFNFTDVFPSLYFITPVITGLKWKVERIKNGIDSVLEDTISEYLQKREGNDNTGGGGGRGEAENFLDILYRIKEQGELSFTLTKENIKAVIFDMFAGGTDTSATTIAWIMSELMRNPEAMRKAKSEVRRILADHNKSMVDEASLSEMKYLNLIVKENLRLHPVLPLLIPRECREDCEIQGYKIPKKTKIVVNAWAIGRDPKKWKEPEKFLPERFVDNPVDFRGTNFDLIPFGSGRRICPGINFGLATVELVVAELLLRFDWKMVSGGSGEDLDMTPADGIIMRRKNPLFLVPVHPTALPT